MRNIKLLSTAILLAVLVFSCGKETQSTTQGGGTFYVRVTINPPLQYGVNPLYNLVTIGCLTSTKSWNSQNQTSNLSTLQCDEVAVTSGQNIQVTFGMHCLYDHQCRSVLLEGVQNGKVIKTYNYEMGYNSCKDLYQQFPSFIMN